MEYLVHVAFGIIALSFAVRDIIWLRLLSITASVTFIVYAATNWAELRAIALWNLVFILVNSAQLAYIYFRERRIRLDEAETMLFERVFKGFSRLEFLQLLKQGEWRSIAAETALVSEGREFTEIFLIQQGKARVEVGDRQVAEVRPGDFVGEMSFITGERASATVTVTMPVRALVWRKEKLRKFLARRPSLRFGLESVFGRDLSTKLKRLSIEASSAHNEDVASA